MSSAISLPITVAKAVEADIPALAEINALAYLPETIMSFLFADWPNPAPLVSYCTARIVHYLKDTNTELYKIFDSGSNEVLGFVCMSNSDGKKQRVRQNNPAGDFEPPAEIGLNLEFATASAQTIAKLEECVKGAKHFVLTSFAVHPKHQGRSLGTKLLERCAEEADEAGLPTFLNAFPGAHGLYRKLGFVDTEHADMDLNEWGKKHRGFGIWRAYGMLRQPTLKSKSYLTSPCKAEVVDASNAEVMRT